MIMIIGKNIATSNSSTIGRKTPSNVNTSTQPNYEVGGVEGKMCLHADIHRMLIPGHRKGR